MKHFVCPGKVTPARAQCLQRKNWIRVDKKHARTLIVKNLIRMHVNTRPMAKNRSDLKKLAGKKMFAPLQGSPVPNDTLVLTWIEKVKITWYWGNLIGLMRRRHVYRERDVYAYVYIMCIYI